MTDRDSLARDYSPQASEEDPLEELARIVSEGIQPPPEPAKPVQPEPEETTEAVAGEDFSQGLEAELAAGLDAAADDGIEEDLAAALAQELDSGVNFAADLSSTDPAMADSSIAVEEPDSAAVQVDVSDSLEDQLLAELGAEEAELDAEPAAPISSTPEPSQTTAFDADFSAAFRKAETLGKPASTVQPAEVNIQPAAEPIPAAPAAPAQKSAEIAPPPDLSQSLKHGMSVTTPTIVQQEIAEADSESAIVNVPEKQPRLFGEDLDLSAAFQAELGKMEARTPAQDEPPVPAEHDASPAVEQAAPRPAAEPAVQDANVSSGPVGFNELDQAIGNLGVLPEPTKPDEASMEQQFADAFAKDLGIELGVDQQAPQIETAEAFQEVEDPAASDPIQEPVVSAEEQGNFEPDASGWLSGDTVDSNQDFVEQAAAGATPEFPGDPGMSANYADEDSIYSEEVSGEVSEPASSRLSGNGFKLAAAALGVALVIGLGVVSYAYFLGGDTPSEPVVIKAEDDPVKVKPNDPGGRTVANQDKASYERVTGDFGEEARQEKLVTTTEQPVEVPSRSFESSNKVEERLPPEQSSLTASSAIPSIQPRRVKTVTVTRDGTVVDPLAPAANAFVQESAQTLAPVDSASGIDGARSTGEIAIPQPRPTEAEPGVSDPQASTAPLENSPQPLAPRTVETRSIRSPIAGETAAIQPRTPNSNQVLDAPSTETTNSVPEPVSRQPVVTEAAPVATPVNAVASATPTAPAAVSEWAVQIASQRSAEDAQSTFQNMQRRFPNILSGRQMSVQRADLVDKGVFYRVRVMADSRDEANTLCSDLKAAGGSCFVTR